MITPHRSFVCVSLLLLLLAPPVCPQETQAGDGPAVLNIYETLARFLATTKALPEYPDEAVKQGVSGVFEVYVGANDGGKVVKVFVPPKINPLLKRPLVRAARAWSFEGFGKHQCPPMAYHVVRLTFNFVIEGGRGRVELYDPPPGADGHLRLRSTVYLHEWQTLEEITDDN